MRRAFAAMWGGARFGVALALILVRRRRLDPAALGAALRRFIESMGFTYVKMGQFMALRFDILPPEVCEELRKLFDRAPKAPFPKVRRWIESELGTELHLVFREVGPDAIAAASLAQVHVATTLDGERLALKIQRPKARRDFEADMWLARVIARIVDATGALPSLSLVDMLREFRAFTTRELDFRTEGRVAEEVSQRTNPGIRVPAIRWDLTTQHLLAMEFIDGHSLGEAIALTKVTDPDRRHLPLPGVDAARVIRAIAHESMRQILVDGLFHADPHPGNILITPDGTVVYVDFGMYGQLSREQRDNCRGYIQHAVMGHPERSFNYFYRLVVPTADLNRAEFKRDMVLLMRDWAEWTTESGDLSERHLGTVMLKTLGTMRANGTRLDTDLTLFWRALFVLDSVALELAEHVDLIDVLHEFFLEHHPSVWQRVDQAMASLPPDTRPARRALAGGAQAARRSLGHRPRASVMTRRARRTRVDVSGRRWAVIAACSTLALAVLVR